MQPQQWLPFRTVVDFDVFPTHLANARPQSLGNSLFCGEPGRQSGRMPSSLDDLAGGKEAVKKAIAVPQNSAIDSIHFNNIHTASQH
jgi:hypothetical protein